jgi:hypothetical protein
MEHMQRPRGARRYHICCHGYTGDKHKVELSTLRFTLHLLRRRHLLLMFLSRDPRKACRVRTQGHAASLFRCFHGLNGAGSFFRSCQWLS